MTDKVKYDGWRKSKMLINGVEREERPEDCRDEVEPDAEK